MKSQLVMVLVAVAALVGCDSARENAREAQTDLKETRQEAAKDIADTQGAAVRDVNEAKEDAAEEIRDAQKDVAEANREVVKEDSSSGATTAAPTNSKGEVVVTKEQCARFATQKEIKTEDKALYEACSKIDKKAYR